MSELKDRIRKIRKIFKLTQKDFGELIGTTQNSIGNYETGHRSPSAAAINNICKTFNVNEKWLRTGEGKIFSEISPAIEADYYIRYLVETGDFIAQRVIASILKAYVNLDENGKEVVRLTVKDLVETLKKNEQKEEKLNTPNKEKPSANKLKYSKSYSIPYGFLFKFSEEPFDDAEPTEFDTESDTESNENNTKTEEN